MIFSDKSLFASGQSKTEISFDVLAIINPQTNFGQHTKGAYRHPVPLWKDVNSLNFFLILPSSVFMDEIVSCVIIWKKKGNLQF